MAIEELQTLWNETPDPLGLMPAKAFFIARMLQTQHSKVADSHGTIRNQERIEGGAAS